MQNKTQNPRLTLKAKSKLYRETYGQIICGEFSRLQSNLRGWVSCPVLCILAYEYPFKLEVIKVPSK